MNSCLLKKIAVSDGLRDPRKLLLTIRPARYSVPDLGISHLSVRQADRNYRCAKLRGGVFLISFLMFGVTSA